MARRRSRSSSMEPSCRQTFPPFASSTSSARRWPSSTQTFNSTASRKRRQRSFSLDCWRDSGFSLEVSGKALFVRKATPGIDATAAFESQRGKDLEGLHAIRDLTARLENNADGLLRVLQSCCSTISRSTLTFRAQSERVRRALAKKPISSEHEAGRSEPSGHLERAAFATFQRNLLGEHDVSDRQLAQRQET